MKVIPNYGRESLLNEGIRTSLGALVSAEKEGVSVIGGEERYVNHEIGRASCRERV